MTTPTPSGRDEWRQHGFLPVIAALGLSFATFQTYGTGPFIIALQQEFGWSRTEIMSGATIVNVSAALLAPFVGMLVDRWGPRRIGLIGVPMVSLGFALLGTATGSAANWQLLWGLIAFSALWIQGTVWTSAVVSRFSVARGKAIAITLCGAALGGAVFPPLATFLIETRGWRDAYMGIALIWFVTIYPLLLLGFRGAQDDRKPASRRDERPPLAGLALSDGLRSPSFYKLMLAGGCFSFTTLALLVHLIPMLVDFGTPATVAGGIAATAGLAAIVGRLGTGVLLDMFPAHIVGAATYLVPITGSLLLLADSGNIAFQVAAAIAFGLTMGAETDVITYLVTRQFGLRAFGTIMGAVFGAIAMGAAFGPLCAGIVFDTVGNYDPFIMASIGLMVVSAVMLWSLGGKAPDTTDQWRKA